MGAGSECQLRHGLEALRSPIGSIHTIDHHKVLGPFLLFRIKTILPQHHRLNPPEGRSPADLGKAMVGLGLEAELLDPQLGVVYTLPR